jgi:catechol 2,3-dioxygenase-like lactoylglutathione lyase family enzyme
MPSLYHVGLTVESLEESVAFYRDVVGMVEIPASSNLEIAGDWFDQLTENEGAKLRVSHLELDGVQLQLVEYAAAGGERLPLHHKMVGNPHLCIDMGNIDERHAALEAEGRYKISPIVTIGGTSFRSFYITDPNGVLVEFIEVPDSPE